MKLSPLKRLKSWDRIQGESRWFQNEHCDVKQVVKAVRLLRPFALLRGAREFWHDFPRNTSMARRDFLMTSFKPGLMSARSASEKCLISESGKSQSQNLLKEPGRRD